jgi:ABC-2 type transport system ATP-binding protein
MIAAMTEGSPIIEVVGVAKTYRRPLRPSRSIHAPRGVTLNVAQGESFGLLGPNGAGKTTLIKILLGIVHPSSGQASIFGHRAGDPRALARVGYLPENHRYPEFLTVEQTMHYFGRLSGLRGRELRRRTDRLLDLVRMSRWRAEKVKRLSKGMQQRLGLAQALVNEPGAVFLDEPTDGVDPLGRRDIRNVLLELRERGVTVFVNSHLLSEVERTCNRVGILKEGKLIYDGALSAYSDGKLRYRILLEAPAGDILSRLGPGVARADDDGNALVVTAGDLDRVNAVIDAIRAAEQRIVEVHPLKASLEDLFVHEIAEQQADRQ